MVNAIKNSKGRNHGYLFDVESELADDFIPLSEYPRPQLVRDSYLCLHGIWDFTVSQSDELPVEFDRKIMVPYSVEAVDSGISYLPQPDDVLYYRRKISLPLGFRKKRVLIHFDGIDQVSEIYINRKKVCSHIGMYDSFVVELPIECEDEFEIIVKVKDLTELSYHSRGKQSLDPFYFTYTTTTGIYKPVWIESVEENYIQDVKFDTDFENHILKVFVKTPKKDDFVFSFNGEEHKITSNILEEIKIDDFHPWDIENPYLYECKIESENDCVKSYFAFRKIELKEHKGFKRMYLNGKPLFLIGLLDQGYYGYNNLTPSSYEDFEKDILFAKKMGFNCLRVHIKTECDMFYYLADKLGMYLIQDYPCGGKKYKFISIGLPRLFSSFNKEKHISLKGLGREDIEGQNEFVEECKYYLNHFHNHPSVLIHTIFNEGWGEFKPSEVYRKLKELDDSILFDSSSGWYESDESDFFSVHTYSIPDMKRKNRYSRCFIISEAGGVGLKYGNCPYKKFAGHGKSKTKEQLFKKIKRLYCDQLLFQIKKYGLSGIIYTQLADVETEYNGLIDLTRENVKIDTGEMKKINDMLLDEFNRAVLSE